MSTVVLRDVLRRDLKEVCSFATTAVVYVGEADEGPRHSCPEDRVTSGACARVAEDDSGILGYLRILLQREVSGVEAELVSMLIAPRARDWAVDRLLIDDARSEAAARGVTLISVLARPPVDAFFRGLGAEARRIVGSWSGAADPRIHLELTCAR